MAGMAAWTTPKRWKPPSQSESTAAGRQTDPDLALGLQSSNAGRPSSFPHSLQGLWDDQDSTPRTVSGGSRPTTFIVLEPV